MKWFVGVRSVGEFMVWISSKLALEICQMCILSLIHTYIQLGQAKWPSSLLTVCLPNNFHPTRRYPQLLSPIWYFLRSLLMSSMYRALWRPRSLIPSGWPNRHFFGTLSLSSILWTCPIHNNLCALRNSVIEGVVFGATIKKTENLQYQIYFYLKFDLFWIGRKLKAFENFSNRELNYFVKL
jgi:hypothetical protein